jgi:TolA-binding protein
MNSKMRSTILIEKYLAGKLKGEKLKNFKKELKNNGELQSLVILHKEINESIDEQEIIKLKNKLNKIYYQFRKTENEDAKEIILDSAPLKRGFTPQKRMVIIAASFTLIVIFGVLLYKSMNKVYSDNELFGMYYKPYEPDIIIRSEIYKPGDLENAILLYDKGNYNTAFDKFVNIIIKDNNNYLAQFYLGLTCMELNKFDTAIDQFTSISENWESPFRYHLEWYLALCYLKNNNKEKARALLIQIKSENRYYQTKAEEILDKLS